MTTVTLPPLPAPGLILFPGFTATKQESFLIKQRKEWKSSNSFLVHFATPTNETGAPFIEIVEIERNKVISFKTMDGQEVMRINKIAHKWSGKDPEYFGMRTDGQEAWYLKLHRGLRGTDYNLTIHSLQQTVSVQKKILGQDRAIMVNGSPVATMMRHEYWSHAHRQDMVHVAPGMDILLALGVNWIHVDKQAMDSKDAVAAAT